MKLGSFFIFCKATFQVHKKALELLKFSWALPRALVLFCFSHSERSFSQRQCIRNSKHAALTRHYLHVFTYKIILMLK